MSNRGLEGPGVPVAQERLLTVVGWLALGAIVFFWLRHDLLARIVAASVFFIMFIVIGALILGVLALYAVLNTWRMLRRRSSTGPADYMDLGWGGTLLGHYTEADSEDLCGLGGGGNGDITIDIGGDD